MGKGKHTCAYSQSRSRKIRKERGKATIEEKKNCRGKWKAFGQMRCGQRVWSMLGCVVGVESGKWGLGNGYDNFYDSRLIEMRMY